MPCGVVPDLNDARGIWHINALQGSHDTTNPTMGTFGLDNYFRNSYFRACKISHLRYKALLHKLKVNSTLLLLFYQNFM